MSCYICRNDDHTFTAKSAARNTNRSTPNATDPMSTPITVQTTPTPRPIAPEMSRNRRRSTGFSCALWNAARSERAGGDTSASLARDVSDRGNARDTDDAGDTGDVTGGSGGVTAASRKARASKFGISPYSGSTAAMRCRGPIASHGRPASSAPRPARYHSATSCPRLLPH